eukprot:10779059-Lingulodinium_polyedra.AAC.1
MAVTAAGMLVGHGAGVRHVLLVPADSRALDVPVMRAVLDATDSALVHTDTCAWGVAWRRTLA